MVSQSRGVGSAGSMVGDHDERAESLVSTESIWHELAKATFAVVSHVTPTGEPRSSGVLCQCVGHKMYVATAPDSWKSRHIALDEHVAVMVPVRRGGLLSLIFPIPPATINFHGTAVLRRADSKDLGDLLDDLKRLLPVERRSESMIIEIHPVGEFLTYGVGVPLMKMRTPATSRGRAPVA